MVEMINKFESKSETSMIFVQMSSRLMKFLMGGLLVLGLKDCLVKCAKMCVKSVVILTIHSKQAKMESNVTKLKDYCPNKYTVNFQ